MASGIDQVECNKMIAASLGITTYVATVTPIFLRLMGTNGSDTANGTEITAGGGYVAGGITTAGAWPASVTGGSVSNSGAAISFTNMPATTVNGVELWDSAGTKLRKWWGSITAKTTNSGDTLTFAQTTGITASLT